MSNQVQQQPVRPFACQECDTRYTRQEHLDRHITAKHRAAKEFKCTSCGKCFARRDILRRHELGHANGPKEGKKSKPAGPGRSAGGGSGGSRREPRESILVGGVGNGEEEEEDEDDGRHYEPVASGSRLVGQAGASSRKRSEDIQIHPELPAKLMRVNRACARCSKSKLRCDGEMPCARCIKSNVDCTYDRSSSWNARQSLPISLAPSASSSSGETSIFTGAESGDDDHLSPDDQRFNQSHSWPHAPGPPIANDAWAGSATGLPLPNHMAIYAVPQARAPPPPSQLHHGALPPSSFQHNLQVTTVPDSTMYLRSNDSFSFPPAREIYADTAMQPEPPIPPPLTSTMNPVPMAFPSQAALGGTTGSLDVIPASWQWEAFGRPSMDQTTTSAGNDFLDLVAASSVEQEIDWDFLNSATWNAAPIGGTGYTPREGNSPAREELEAQLLASSAGELTQSLHAPAMIFEPPPQLNVPEYEIEATIRARSNSDIRIQDSVAVSLLQLASHTPRQSPEPEKRPLLHRALTSATNHSNHGEEKPRSSHTSYTPSDPWPMSYRPSVPQEVVLPNGRSRAPTPMRDFEEVEATVPRMNEETRERILHNVRESCVGVPHFEQSHRFVPQVELLDLFVQLFFLHYQTLVPLLHSPTFDPNTCPSFLLLAVASIGARYAHDIVPNATMYSHALLETGRRMLQMAGDIDNTLLRTVAWVQASILTLQVGLYSGNKRDLERTQSFNGLPVTLCRRQGWLKEPEVDEAVEASFSLEERWIRWRDREEIKRLGFATIKLDGYGTLMWDLESTSLFVEGARTSLPCNDQLWEAPTAVAWQALFRGSILPERSIDLLTAINHVSERSMHSSERLLASSHDAFAMSVVLIVLHCIGWTKLREAHVTSMFLPAAAQLEQRVTPVQASLEAGLEFFEERVILPPEMQEALAESSSSANSLALMVHLTSMTARLPLRILQALARAGHSQPSSSTLDSVKAWALQDGGITARTTIFHAGQLLGLARLSEQSAPLAPFALFCAAMSLLAYVDNTPAVSRDGHRGQRRAVIRLDKLMDRHQDDLAYWLSTGDGVPMLEGVGSIEVESALERGGGSQREVGEKEQAIGRTILHAVGTHLLENKVWKVAEQLGRTLLQRAGADGVNTVVKEEEAA